MGQKYKVIKPFTDYDGFLHPVGEIWTFLTTNFLPYDDGLTLHVTLDSGPNEVVYRLQWREDQQAAIIEGFNQYVEAVTSII